MQVRGRCSLFPSLFSITSILLLFSFIAVRIATRVIGQTIRSGNLFLSSPSSVLILSYRPSVSSLNGCSPTPPASRQIDFTSPRGPMWISSLKVATLSSKKPSSTVAHAALTIAHATSMAMSVSSFQHRCARNVQSQLGHNGQYQGQTVFLWDRRRSRTSPGDPPMARQRGWPFEIPFHPQGYANYVKAVRQKGRHRQFIYLWAKRVGDCIELE